MANSAIGTPTFQAKAENIQNTDGSSIYSSGTWIFKNGSGTTNLFMDSSGLVGIGTSSPTFKVDAALGSVSSATNGLRLSTSNIGNLVLGMSQASTNMGTASTSADIYTTAGLDMRFGTNGAERMRIDANGNVGIGTTSPGGALGIARAAGVSAFMEIAGNGGTPGENSVFIGQDELSTGYVWNREYAPLSFGTYGIECMRIDEGARLQIGMTNGLRKVNISHLDSLGYGVVIGANISQANSGVGVFTTNLGSGNGAQNNSNCWHFRGVTSNVGIWYLYGNGTSSFTSDQRLKKNIEPARDGYVEDLCKLRVVKYNWITNEDSEAKELGLIAQQVEQVFPNLVQEADVEFEGGLKPKVLKSSVLPFMLLKAIQEQQAQIESLKSEIEALKLK